ncbi:MAG TPA: 50S ribosomal protein L6 [Armatimonadetes bacterium]|jgi:large subunit ribosomal protein L6|nr:50S ribosomal protein L6 [Armatimonadota bacterium]
MSRVGRKPIPVPAGVDVKIADREITVKGPKGTLSHQLPPDLIVTREDGQIVVDRPDDEKLHRCLHGLTRTLIANMIEGVTQGYTKTLEIHGVGYRAAKASDTRVTLTLGFAHPVEVIARPGITFDVEGTNRVIVKGIDKQMVGQTAAEIRAVRKPEPYKGKGVRYLGEEVRLKAGKTAKAAKGGK